MNYVSILWNIFHIPPPIDILKILQRDPLNNKYYIIIYNIFMSGPNLPKSLKPNDVRENR